MIVCINLLLPWRVNLRKQIHSWWLQILVMKMTNMNTVTVNLRQILIIIIHHHYSNNNQTKIPRHLSSEIVAKKSNNNLLETEIHKVSLVNLMIPATEAWEMILFNLGMMIERPTTIQTIVNLTGLILLLNNIRTRNQGKLLRAFWINIETYLPQISIAKEQVI